MISFRRIIKGIAGFGLVALCASPGRAAEVDLQFSRPSFTQVKSDTTAFELKFTDFRRGSISDEVVVEYQVTSNLITRQKDVIQAQLNDGFDGVKIRARFNGYTPIWMGSALVAPSQDWRTVDSHKSIGIADHSYAPGRPGMLSGRLTVRYRAEAVEDLWAQNEARFMTITMVTT